jgi:MFS family permease
LALPELRALLVARGFGAVALSSLATVVGFQAWDMTGDPLALGLLGLVEAIPALGLTLIGGHVADRRDRRSVVLLSLALLALGALALMLISLQPEALGLAGLLGVVFFLGIAAGFERPALTAFETQVIPREFASKGVSLTGSIWTAGGILGPAIGGLSIAFLGLPATYAAIGILFVLSMLAVLRIAPKPMPVVEVPESFVKSVSSGVGYVARHQVLLGSMALDLFAVFFGGAIALMPVFAIDILGVGPVGLGLLRTAPAVGALLAMLATTKFAPRRHAGAILLTSVGIFGVSMIVFGLSTSFLLSMVAMFVAGLADGISVVIRILILRVESPEALRGRIASVNFLFIGTSNELGALESGIAASLFGVAPAVIGGGVVTLGVVAAVAIFAPALRRLDLGERLRNGPGMAPVEERGP